MVFECIKLREFTGFVLVFAACNCFRKCEVTVAEMAMWTLHSMVVDELHGKKDNRICNQKL